MPGVSFTMEIISPASALNSVDFPTLGLPTTATIGFLFLAIYAPFLITDNISPACPLTMR